LKHIYADTLRIAGLRFYASHGVFSEEKNRKQPFEVDVDISLDLSHPANTDNIEDTLDYTAVAATVRDVVEGPQCNLLEKLAGTIIDRLTLLVCGGMITVRIRKPEARLGVPTGRVEIELTREV
jgi:7,8-dihydroneopterin aldolase/epimerase/oxygenase